MECASGAGACHVDARHVDGRHAEGRRADVRAYFDVASVRDLLARCGASAADVAALSQLVSLEWELFDRVEGLDGRATCQDNARSFFVYRLAQYLAFPFGFAHLALDDVKRLAAAGRNPVEEKYARMMAATDPDRFQAVLVHKLPPVSPVRACALRDVECALQPFVRAASNAAPTASAHARVETSLPQRVSAVDYLVGEVAPYSLRTVWYLRDALRDMAAAGTNPIVDAYAYACAIDSLTGV